LRRTNELSGKSRAFLAIRSRGVPNNGFSIYPLEYNMRSPSRRSPASQPRRKTADTVLGKGIRLAQNNIDTEAGLDVEHMLSTNSVSSISLVHAADFYFRRNQPERAIPLFLKITELEPNNPVCWRNLGVGYASACDHVRAEYAFRRATSIEPEDALALEGLARTLLNLGRHLEAVDLLQPLIAREPSNLQALFTLGTTLTEMGELDGAEMAFLQIVIASPNMAEAYTNIGRIHILRGPGHQEDAMHFLRTALAIKPNLHSALINLGAAHLRLGQIDEAERAYRDALKAKPDDARAFSNLLFCLQSNHNISNEFLFAEHRRFSRQLEAPLRAHWPSHQNARLPERKLRLGYVSGDFRDHPVTFFLEPLLIHRDRESFELCFYSNHPREDEVTRRLMRYASEWTVCAHMNDAELAAKITSDRIDILVDLSGHTAYNRLPVFARKPAPVQVTYIGYAGSTGLDAMDYRITDAWLDPIGMTDQWHSEEVVRLPGGNAAFQVVENAPTVGMLPALAGSGITLACLNNPRKISPPVVMLWSKILAARPDARLLLGGVSDNAIKAELLARFAASGIDPARIMFQPWMPLQGYLALHQKIDLALDPFPYNGGTTSYHSLWMGVPFVTLAGDRTVSRCGAALLSTVGLDDWIADNEDAYVQKTLTALEDLPALNLLRQSLRLRLRPADDGRSKRVAFELETAYRSMWQRWCQSSN
jgi:predicted O-linked N-acetylglucosamine transferase (SPINDLY family)